MSQRLLGLIGKEFRQMLRDPIVLFLIFWLTTTEVAMCTMAVGMDVRNLKLGVIDYDQTPISQTLIQEMTSADTLILNGVFTSGREAEGQGAPVRLRRQHGAQHPFELRKLN